MEVKQDGENYEGLGININCNCCAQIGCPQIQNGCPQNGCPTINHGCSKCS